MAASLQKFNAPYPEWAICPLSDPPQLMNRPVLIICQSGKHVLEGTEQLRDAQHCPMHPSVPSIDTWIFLKHEDEALKQAIQAWKAEHEIKEIDAFEVTKWLLFPREIPPNVSFADLKAHLRFLEFFGKIPELAAQLVRWTCQMRVSIPNFEEMIPFDPTILPILRHLTSEINNISIEPQFLQSREPLRAQSEPTPPERLSFTPAAWDHSYEGLPVQRSSITPHYQVYKGRNGAS